MKELEDKKKYKEDLNTSVLNQSALKMMISNKFKAKIVDTMASKNELIIKKIQAQFESINLNVMQLILDPLLGAFFFPLKCCLKNFGCYRRPKILAKCEDTYANELEITNLLQKIRDTHAMVANLQTRKHRILLKYSKDRVINIDTSSSDESSSSSSSNDENLKPNHMHKEVSDVLGFSIIKGLKLSLA